MSRKRLPLKNRFFLRSPRPGLSILRRSRPMKQAFCGKGRDIVCINQGRRIAEGEAIRHRNSMMTAYTMPGAPPQGCKGAGTFGPGAALYAGINGMWRGNYATDHDVVVAKKAGLCHVRPGI